MIHTCDNDNDDDAANDNVTYTVWLLHTTLHRPKSSAVALLQPPQQQQRQQRQKAGIYTSFETHDECQHTQSKSVDIETSETCSMFYFFPLPYSFLYAVEGK
jgi:hypothetical protein